MSWSPARIFGDEITVRHHPTPCRSDLTVILQIIGSFAQVHCFPRAIAYLESGKISVKGMVTILQESQVACSSRFSKVTDIFSIKDYQKALDKLNSKTACKIAVKP